MKRICLFSLLVCCFASHAQVNTFDIIINEIMVDPTPVVGLPNAEWIELKNCSSTAVNLHSWKLVSPNSSATINSDYLFQPDSFLILCSNASIAGLQVYGPVISINSFPSLNNDAGIISLQSKEGKTIHAISYDNSWYNNPVKRNGGYSLEMKDPRNPCSGKSNWTASTANIGGTPGKKNAAGEINPDISPPSAISAFAPDSHTIIISSSETLDSSFSVSGFLYEVDNDIGPPIAVSIQPPLMNKIMLKLQRPLQQSMIYSILIKSLQDCSGNKSGKLKINTSLVSLADASDVIINEILFNPKQGGTDYVEIYNRSNRAFSLSDLYISTRLSNNTIDAPKKLCEENILIFPGEYRVITADSNLLITTFSLVNRAEILEIPSLPSLPDDAGDVLLLNSQGFIIDELKYDESWHFKLFANKEGISLERIDYDKPTQDMYNWHSASTTSAFGTPGDLNSQFHVEGSGDAEIDFTPKIFSPDNDGFDDFVTINYHFDEPGYVMNITVFDLSARPLRFLIRNVLCGRAGYFRWDGLDEKHNHLARGVYVLLIEYYNLKGRTKKIKKPIILARQL